MLNLQESNCKIHRIKSLWGNKLIGLGVFDALARDITDPETGEVYPALSCYNNPDMAARCTDRNAEKVIWSIKGNASFNSDCAVLLREGFRSGKIRLLAPDGDGSGGCEELLGEIKGYKGLNIASKAKIQAPYIHTTLLIDELTKLQHEETNGRVKVYEKAGMRKDRYSSLAYNYYVALQIESRVRRSKGNRTDFDERFLFRAPKIK